MTDVTDAGNPLAGVLSTAQIDALVGAAEGLGEGRHGVEELLTQMTKAVLERAMETRAPERSADEAATWGNVVV